MADGFRRPARILDEAHKDVETADALEDLTGAHAADSGADGLLHGAKVDPVARDGLAVGSDHQLRRANHLGGLHVGSPFDLPDLGHNEVGLGLQGIEVIAEELDRQLRLDAADHLVDGELDRLGDVGRHAWKVLKHGSDFIFNIALILLRVGPLADGLEDDVAVDDVDRGRVRPDFPPADPRHHLCDLRNLQYPLLHPHRHFLALAQRGRGRHSGVDHDVAFVQAGREFRTEQGKERRTRAKHGRRQHDGRPVPPHEEPEHRPVEGQQHPHQQVLARRVPVAAGFPAAHHRLAEHRRKQQCKEQGAEHGQRDRVGERPEGLAFDSIEREQGQKDNDDDRDGEDNRPAYFPAGAPHKLDARQVRLRPVHDPVDVLDHHHRAVHDHADGDGKTAQRHQVGADAESAHRQCGEEHRERYRRSDHQARPDPAHEHEQYQRHQHNPLRQRARHGLHRLVHQFFLLVVGHNAHALGQRLLHLGQLRLDPVDHRRGIRAVQLHDHAGNHFLLAVPRLEPPAYGAAGFNTGHVVQMDRGAVYRLHHNGGQVIEAVGEAHRAHQKLFAAPLQKLGAHVEIVFAHPVEHFGKRHVVTNQRLGVNIDLVLLLIAADAQHLGDARHRLQLVLHNPVLHRAQFRQ